MQDWHIASKWHIMYLLVSSCETSDWKLRKKIPEVSDIFSATHQTVGHGSKTSWICRSLLCLSSLMLPRITIVKLSADNSREQNKVVCWKKRCITPQIPLWLLWWCSTVRFHAFDTSIQIIAGKEQGQIFAIIEVKKSNVHWNNQTLHV